MEDTAIIRLFQERSQQAIAELSQKYGKLCQSLSRRILNNEEDAKECVKDKICKFKKPKYFKK